MKGKKAEVQSLSSLPAIKPYVVQVLSIAPKDHGQKISDLIFQSNQQNLLVLDEAMSQNLIKSAPKGSNLEQLSKPQILRQIIAKELIQVRQEKQTVAEGGQAKKQAKKAPPKKAVKGQKQVEEEEEEDYQGGWDVLALTQNWAFSSESDISDFACLNKGSHLTNAEGEPVDFWIEELYKDVSLNSCANHDGIDLFVNTSLKIVRVAQVQEQPEENDDSKQVKFKEPQLQESNPKETLEEVPLVLSPEEKAEIKKNHGIVKSVLKIQQNPKLARTSPFRHCDVMEFEIVLTLDENGLVPEKQYQQAKKDFFSQIAARHQAKLAYKLWLSDQEVIKFKEEVFSDPSKPIQEQTEKQDFDAQKQAAETVAKPGEAKKAKPEKSGTTAPQKGKDIKEASVVQDLLKAEPEAAQPIRIPEISKQEYDKELIGQLESRFEYFRGTNFLDVYSKIIDNHQTRFEDGSLFKKESPKELEDQKKNDLANFIDDMFDLIDGGQLEKKAEGNLQLKAFILTPQSLLVLRRRAS